MHTIESIMKLNVDYKTLRIVVFPIKKNKLEDIHFKEMFGKRSWLFSRLKDKSNYSRSQSTKRWFYSLQTIAKLFLFVKQNLVWLFYRSYEFSALSGIWDYFFFSKKEMDCLLR